MSETKIEKRQPEPEEKSLKNKKAENSPAKKNYTYILRCGDGSLYTGWTTNIDKRLEEHRCGKGAKYTRGRGPLTLVHLEVFETKSAAMKREAAIKTLSHAEKEELLADLSWKELLAERNPEEMPAESAAPEPENARESKGD